VVVVDISDPAAPAPVGQGCYADDVNGILATRNNVFVASGMGNLLAYRRQCGDPSPVYLAAFDLAADGGEVRAAWSLAPGADDVAFRLAARRGDESWEVPVRQVDAGHWEAVDDSPRLQAGGTVVYSLACRSADGAWRELDSRAIDVATPALRTALTAVSPNPFNPQTEIAFAVDSPQRVVIAAYDLSGRRVARLTDRVYPAGPHTIRWDGRDDRGRAVASGTYLLRLEGRGTTDLRKLMLVR
jgi:hypothetical protein